MASIRDSETRFPALECYNYSMRTRTRTRFLRIAKWTGSTLVLLILCTWILSVGYWAEYRTSDGNGFNIRDGLIELIHPMPPPDQETYVVFPFTFWPGWRAGRNWGRRSIGVRMPKRMRDDGQISQYRFPLWIPFAACALPTAILWYHDRRRPGPGQCQTCGYDLTGNQSGNCPECGHATARCVGAYQTQTPEQQHA